MRKLLVTVCVSWFSFCCVSAYAVNWVNLSESPLKIGIDTDSIRVSDNTPPLEFLIDVTYRVDETEYDATVDCAQHSKSVSVVRTTNIFTKKIESTKVTGPGSDNPVSNIYKDLRLQFPAWRSDYIENAVCKKFQLDWNTLLPSFCQAFSAQSQKYFCSSSAELVPHFNYLVFRLNQLKNVCTVSTSDSNSILVYLIGKIDECKDEKCFSNKIYEYERGIGNELAAVLGNNAKCTYVEYMLTKIDRDYKYKTASTGVRNCLKQAPLKLDDGISSADVIARGSIAACRQAIADQLYWQGDPHGAEYDIKIVDAVEQQLLLGITSEVLKNRAVKQQQRESQQKKPSKPKSLEM